MSTHTPASPSTPTPVAPPSSHRVAGPASWLLGSLATALSTMFVVQVGHVALVEWATYEGGMALTAVILLGGELTVIATLWLLFLVAFLPLRRDGGVTRPAAVSAAVVGVATGALLHALTV